ncbi:HAD-IC family P-type ATPase [Aliikangiella sp. G2MR2-5]|uniref:cation-translocating P-type ATPase n=1 Tax=Aliikangiella sp. G2MR2-5 TaxID=2788943 RepID=UPI0018A9EBA7|nr:HAD-IC family P-type ATPase [Aliikangiella sp. G2MR2-5]
MNQSSANKKNSHPGLTSAEAKTRLLQQGENRLPEAETESFVIVFAKQFKSPFIYVLLIAAVVSFFLGQNINGLFIFAVLLLNASIGSFQEYSAEKAAKALNAMVPHLANVVRDGHVQQIDTRSIVTGDYVLLASGDKVPADGQCMETNQLTVDESLLTGESIAVLKVIPETDAPVRDTNLCFAGTTVVKGRGLIKVGATGLNTEIGKIAKAVTKEDKTKPPLLQRIERFTLRVTIATLVIIALIFIISLIRGEAISQVFFLGVALAVSAIPEGLPAAITVALAIGMRRMAKQNVIVRSLLAVESLGSCTYIASDKTGTLTVNNMTIQKILLIDGSEFDVTGEGIDIHGQIEAKNNHNSKAEKLCEVGVLSNEAELYLQEGEWRGQGDQVDIAFLVLYNKLGKDHQQLQFRYRQINRIPYESENAYNASLNRINGQYRLSVKGSAEKLVQMSNLNEEQRRLISQQVLSLAEQGYRVLALADKVIESVPVRIEDSLNQLNFIGLVGIIDPLRKTAAESVALCRQASIEVGMITGDHPETARAIAKKLRINDPDERVISGCEISEAKSTSTERLNSLTINHHTFARVRPLEKQIIVESLESQGHFVAVTGDGVNDAPALKSAHVGIAMGKRGTDVARESADLILTDDNFSSLVNGIKEGRIVYANIRKVVFLLISTGAAEILLFILSLIAGLPLPLYPIQLLWLNLVTNGVQDVALAFEPAEGNELKKPPRKPSESIFNKTMIERVLINAIVMGSLAFALFALSLKAGMAETEARNITLLLMVLFENVHALNSRSEIQSLFKMNFFSNRLLLIGILVAQTIHIGAMYTDTLGSLLEITPVSFIQWTELLSIALSLILVDEFHKWILRKKHL